MEASNNHIVLVMGKPSSGKSTSLHTLTNPDRTIYLNTDLKALPFKDQFKHSKSISDSLQIVPAIEEIEKMEDVDTVVLDTITFLMNQYEEQYVVNATNGMQAWQKYASFYKKFIHAIKKGSKNYIILAHEKEVFNEKEMITEVKVPIKGSVGNIGCEADFTTIIATKRISLNKLKGVENSMLAITPEDEARGVKYVFQTSITKETINEKMRSAIGLWDSSELYIDNNIQHVIDRLDDYYTP